MLEYAKSSDSKKILIASETGLLHQMKKDSPEKEFLIVPTDENCSCNDCEYMKKNTLQKVYDCLVNEKPEITLDNIKIEKAKKSIEKMLQLSKIINYK
jgi:quinolinate synthase